VCPNCAHDLRFCHFCRVWHNVESVTYAGSIPGRRTTPPPGTTPTYLELIVYDPSENGVCTACGPRPTLEICSHFSTAI
jgi:hypothetical protein